MLADIHHPQPPAVGYAPCGAVPHQLPHMSHPFVDVRHGSASPSVVHASLSASHMSTPDNGAVPITEEGMRGGSGERGSTSAVLPMTMGAVPHSPASLGPTMCNAAPAAMHAPPMHTMPPQHIVPYPPAAPSGQSAALLPVPPQPAPGYYYPPAPPAGYPLPIHHAPLPPQWPPQQAHDPLTVPVQAYPHAVAHAPYSHAMPAHLPAAPYPHQVPMAHYGQVLHPPAHLQPQPQAVAQQPRPQQPQPQAGTLPKSQIPGANLPIHNSATRPASRRKTTYCNFYPDNIHLCPFGAQCAYAHTKQERKVARDKLKDATIAANAAAEANGMVLPTAYN